MTRYGSASADSGLGTPSIDFFVAVEIKFKIWLFNESRLKTFSSFSRSSAGVADTHSFSPFIEHPPLPANVSFSTPLAYHGFPNFRTTAAMV